MSNKIIIKRDSGYADRLRAYKIILDGKIIGKIKNNETVELSVSEGFHSIHMTVDWCRSNIVNFESDREVITFDCKSSLRGFQILFAIFYITFLRNQYIRLEQIGKS